jgi:hypothetical protein
MADSGSVERQCRPHGQARPGRGARPRRDRRHVPLGPAEVQLVGRHHLGSSRTVVSEVEAPSMLVNLV